MSLVWVFFNEIQPTHSFGAISILRLKILSKIGLTVFNFPVTEKVPDFLLVVVFVHQLCGSVGRTRGPTHEKCRGKALTRLSDVGPISFSCLCAVGK